MCWSSAQITKFPSGPSRLATGTKTSYIVVEGLKAGERVVTEGVQKVRPGMVVKPTTTAGGAA